MCGYFTFYPGLVSACHCELAMGIDQGKALVRVVATFRISHFTPGPAAAAVVDKFGFKTGRNWQKSRERKISLRFGGTCSNFQREGCKWPT